MKNKYRIVRDGYAGYEAQFRPWWSPFWFQCFFVNTRSTIEAAEEVARTHAKPTVKELGAL
jgi:hypothetical protein